jgi:hypothetical protein
MGSEEQTHKSHIANRRENHPTTRCYIHDPSPTSAPAPIEITEATCPHTIWESGPGPHAGIQPVPSILSEHSISPHMEGPMKNRRRNPHAPQYLTHGTRCIRHPPTEPGLRSGHNIGSRSQSQIFVRQHNILQCALWGTRLNSRSIH